MNSDDIETWQIMYGAIEDVELESGVHLPQNNDRLNGAKNELQWQSWH